jgi:hypothetical protein
MLKQSAYQQREIAKLRRRRSRDLAREQRLCTTASGVWVALATSVVVALAHAGVGSGLDAVGNLGHGIEIFAPAHVLWRRRELIRRELNTRRGELIRVLT